MLTMLFLPLTLIKGSKGDISQLSQLSQLSHFMSYICVFSSLRMWEVSNLILHTIIYRT